MKITARVPISDGPDDFVRFAPGALKSFEGAAPVPVTDVNGVIVGVATDFKVDDDGNLTAELDLDEGPKWHERP